MAHKGVAGGVESAEGEGLGGRRGGRWCGGGAGRLRDAFVSSVWQAGGRSCGGVGSVWRARGWGAEGRGFRVVCGSAWSLGAHSHLVRCLVYVLGLGAGALPGGTAGWAALLLVASAGGGWQQVRLRWRQFFLEECRRYGRPKRRGVWISSILASRGLARRLALPACTHLSFISSQWRIPRLALSC